MSSMDRLIEVIAKLNTLYNSIVKHDSGRILGSMTTKPHPLAIYSYLLFIHTNLADTVMYPELIDLKNELQKDLSKYYGEISELMVTTGGTESNFTAILSAWKNRGFREKIVIAPDTVHVSIDKTCDIIDCRLIKIPVGNKPVEPDIVEEYVRKYNPFAIVITAGTTERGL
ncbi:MAG: tyrosine decarboxylase MfnA, partial [Desulfurococcaceae archaeon]